MTVAGDTTNWRTDVKVSTVRRWLLAEENGSALPEYFDRALRPMAAVTELIYLCESILDGRDPPRSRDRISLQREIKLAMWLGDEVVFPGVEFAGVSDPNAEKREVFMIPSSRIAELAGERWTPIDEEQG